MKDKRLIDAVIFILKHPTWENRANLEILLEGEDIEEIAAEIAGSVARIAHKNQAFRSGEGFSHEDDYTNMHLAGVARIVGREFDFPNDYEHLVTLCAAWLHDVVEDTNLNLESVRRAFGDDVAFIVDRLTKDIDQQLTNNKLYSFVPAVAQVKLADIYRNAETISFSKSKKAASNWALKKLVQIRSFYQPDQVFLDKVKGKLNNLVITE
ncbi:hypothetical protein [Providencia phage PSTCR5]|uniref:Uncharacterized protein n=1 Tax=Providencia phage PSTCR5 TaxID=2783547 RepID=A0A873WTF7_9CAUD|nr:metal-dependent phosphohydrolase [Providencia phage PSTCR5]QPB12174.1 hypothetical protein [Providencia phage PSTCR5]